MPTCKTIGCQNPISLINADFCPACYSAYSDLLSAIDRQYGHHPAPLPKAPQQPSGLSAKTVAPTLSQRYPKYFRAVDHLDAVDVYAVHQLFGIDDPSGALQHASKKLLLSGSRTGGKTKLQDIREARDTLNRWLELQEQFEASPQPAHA